VGEVLSGHFERRISRVVSGDYRLYLPKEYKPRGRARYPLVLFLHGFGERGSDLGKLEFHGPFKEVAKGRDFAFILVAPQMPETETSWDALKLSALLDEIEAKYRVDPRRIYLTGISMGGFGVWSLVAFSPNRFAAAVPICGGGNYLAAIGLRDLPIWAIHGEKDPAVPLAQGQAMIDGVIRGGGKPQFTIVKDGLHDVWTTYYEGSKLYEWLLEQRRP